MKTQYFPVVITQDEDGVYIGRVSNLPGCHTYGKTLDELHKNLDEVIALWTEVNKSKKYEALKFHSFQFFEFRPQLHA